MSKNISLFDDLNYLENLCFRLDNEIAHGYCIRKCNRETLNGQEVIDIDISTSNEAECETAKMLSTSTSNVIFVLWYALKALMCCTLNYSSKAHN